LGELVGVCLDLIQLRLGAGDQPVLLDAGASPVDVQGAD
jgi:hypothetical protein